jgi:hypothetical protein
VYQISSEDRGKCDASGPHAARCRAATCHARNYTAGKERIQCTFADQIKGKDWIGNKKDQIDLIFFLPVFY